jgi:hypothetical protein
VVVPGIVYVLRFGLDALSVLPMEVHAAEKPGLSQKCSGNQNSCTKILHEKGASVISWK